MHTYYIHYVRIMKIIQSSSREIESLGLDTKWTPTVVHKPTNWGKEAYLVCTLTPKGMLCCAHYQSHTYMHARTHTYTWTTHTHICTHAHTLHKPRACTHTRTHTCTHVTWTAHACTHTHVHTHMHTHMSCFYAGFNPRESPLPNPRGRGFIMKAFGGTRSTATCTKRDQIRTRNPRNNYPFKKWNKIICAYMYVDRFH